MLEPADDAWRNEHLPLWWKEVQNENYELKAGMSVVNILFAGKHGFGIYGFVEEAWYSPDSYEPTRLIGFVHVKYKNSGSESKSAAQYYIPDIDDEKTRKMLGL
jgi:hypothetical protein